MEANTKLALIRSTEWCISHVHMSRLHARINHFLPELQVLDLIRHKLMNLLLSRMYSRFTLACFSAP